MAGHNLDFPMPQMKPTEIRFLRLLPASSFDHALNCDLAVVPRNAANQCYEALSYVWGSTAESNLGPVTVNSKTFLTTSNLRAALRHLRYADRGRILWVDALCLNQNDVEEKNHIVPKMHLIYSSAESVVAWQGKSYPGTGRALKLVDALSDIWDEAWEQETLWSDEKLRDLFTSKLSCGQIPEAADERWAELGVLFLDSWWDRVWTIQEAVCNRFLRFVWGAFSTSGRSLVALQLLGNLEALGFISVPTIKAMRAKSRLRELESLCGDVRGQGYVSLGTALEASYRRRAKDERDYVYGCLSLTDTSTHRITVDYGKSVSEVFEDTTRALIEEGQSQRGGLNFLVACGIKGTQQVDSLTPFWVISFGQPVEYVIPCDPFSVTSRFDAAGSHPGQSVFSARRGNSRVPSGLLVRGLFVGQVALISAIRVPSKVFKNGNKDGMLIRQFHSQCMTLVSQTHGLKTASTDKSVHESLHRTLIEDRKVAGANMPNNEGPWSPIYMTYAHLYCAGKCFFITNTGYMGLAPHAIESGDSLFIIAGCDVPIVLRRAKSCQFTSHFARGDGHHLERCTVQAEDATHNCQESYYRIVSSAYVHGVMHGEAIVLDDHGNPNFEDINLL